MTPGMGARKTLVRKGRGRKSGRTAKREGRFAKVSGEGKEGRRLQGRALRNLGLIARKTPHRMPRTASASPLGEGEERRARGREFGHGGCWGWAHERKTPHRMPVGTPASASPLGEGKEGRRLQGRALRNPGLGARRTPHRLPVGTPASASPLGEGEERRARGREGGDGGCWGWAHERKTPHRFPATTPESASPPGEGEEGAGPLEGLALRTRPWVTQRSPLGEGERGAAPLRRALRNLGLGARRTPHRFPATTPESASPPGEGEEGAGPLEGLAARTRPLGWGKVSTGRGRKRRGGGVVWRLVAAAGF